jgi:LemA protein
MVAGFYVGLALLVIVTWVLFAYHRFAHYGQVADKAWEDIASTLANRSNLILELIAALRRLGAADQATLDRIRRAHERSLAATGPREHADAQDSLQATLFSLFVSLEGSPHVTTDAGLEEVQQALARAEDDMHKPRKLYNAAVEELNYEISSFPKNLIAAAFRIRVREYYETAEEAQRNAPLVVL